MRPLASIVVPAYNTGRWIGAALRSILGQTVAGIEVIVVDDGSTDDTYDAVRAMADPRVSIVRQEHAGISAARNAGMALASAAYIGFLDSDDVWLPRKLEEHLAVFDSHPEIDLTFSWSLIVNEDGTPTRHMLKARTGVTDFEDILTRDPIGNGSCLVLRRSALDRAGTFDLRLRACTDHDMWLRVARLRRNNAWCIPQLLTHYRRRTGQITRSWRLARTETEKVMDKVRRLEPALPSSVLRRAEASNCHAYAFMAYEAGELVPALRLEARALLLSPWSGRRWSLMLAIAVRLLFPARLFRFAQRFRASTKRLSSGRLSSSSASGTSPR